MYHVLIFFDHFYEENMRDSVPWRGSGGEHTDKANTIHYQFVEALGLQYTWSGKNYLIKTKEKMTICLLFFCNKTPPF